MHSFFIRSLNRVGLLPFINTTVKLKFDGTEILVPIKGTLGLNYLHLPEPWMIEVLKKLKPVFNGNFIDIGVNIGQSLVKAMVVFGKINYWGFEPNPVCIYYVQEFIKLNKFPNCNIFPVGISNETEILKLHFFNNEASDQAASIVENFRPAETILGNKYVAVFDFERFKDHLPGEPNTIVKIDVEGAELNVLEGLAPWIEKTQPIILVEILPIYKIENNFRLERQLKLESLLKSLGYVVFRIDKSGQVNVLLIDTIGVHGNVDDGDYILVHNTMTQKVKELFA